MNQTRTRWMGLRTAGITAAGISLAILLSAVPSLSRRNPNPRIFPPKSHSFGNTYEEWSVLSWQGVFGTPFDPAACTVGEVGNVLLLTASTGEPAEFFCCVPTGKSLLFPIISTAFLCPCDCGPDGAAPNGTIDELTEAAVSTIDLFTLLEVEIDGSPVEGIAAYRFLSPVFFGTAVEGNVFEFFCGNGPYGPAVADGYFLMLSPLPPGEHEIHIRAGIPELSVELETTHFITVVRPSH